MRSLRITSSNQRPAARLIKQHGHKKADAVKALQNGHSAGAVTRAMELPPSLVLFWRKEAGIAPLKAGQCRPTPAVGEVLV